MPHRLLILRLRIACSLALTPFLWQTAFAGHAYAQFGDIAYAPDFSHFAYANPRATKGGSITLPPPSSIAAFDKYNPFTLKGTAPPGLVELTFDSLLTGSLDEPATAYGLLAEEVTLAPDEKSVRFRLNPQARFHNGDPVLAKDIQYTFDQLISSKASPVYRSLLIDVKKAEILDARTLRFEFTKANRQLPLILGSLPILSHKQSFDRLVTQVPIASGPYRVVLKKNHQAALGHDISYARDKNYWAQDLNVRKGLYNFDRVTFKLYQDQTAQLEAFKAGEFDMIQAFTARDWARAYRGNAFDNGTLIKQEWQHHNPADFQGFMLNLRRPFLQDVRVRKALSLALDFEWMNRLLFYQSYTRVRGYFTGTEFEASDLPSDKELALFQDIAKELKKPIATEILTHKVPLPPSTQAPSSLRANLRQAKQLLEEAGWTYRNGALRNLQGQPFELEFIDTGGMGRVVAPYIRNLEKLGMAARYRVLDASLLQKRLDAFDFDMTSIRTQGQMLPGSELWDRHHSQAADVEGSSNLNGLKNPLIDALLLRVLKARTREELKPSLRALDRVLRHTYVSVPHWYSPVYRMAYRPQAFKKPNQPPPYGEAQQWVLSTWWAR